MFMLVLTVVLTAPYIRACCEEEDGMSRAAPRTRRSRVAVDALGPRWSSLVCVFPVYWMVSTLVPAAQPDPQR